MEKEVKVTQKNKTSGFDIFLGIIVLGLMFYVTYYFLGIVGVGLLAGALSH